MVNCRAREFSRLERVRIHSSAIDVYRGKITNAPDIDGLIKRLKEKNA